MFLVKIAMANLYVSENLKNTKGSFEITISVVGTQRFIVVWVFTLNTQPFNFF